MLLSYNVVPVNDCVPRSFVRRVNICFFIDAGGLRLIHSNLFSALRANLALRKFGRGYSVAYSNAPRISPGLEYCSVVFLVVCV